MAYLVSIAGGSGAGKSTLAYALKDKFPDIIEVLHFDDFQKMEEDIPVTFGMKNWDHIEAINFDELFDTLKKLKKDKNVEVNTKSLYHNPEYEEKGRIPYIVQAKKIILIEGYLTLYSPKIREMYDYKIFLDLEPEERIKRRLKFVNDEYTKKILNPMYSKFVEPTKEFADLIIDVKKYSAIEVQDLIIKKLREKGLL